jgi:hypothetical protein
MKRPPPEDRLKADQRLYDLAYAKGEDAGYDEGYSDGHEFGEGQFQEWLKGELATLANDLRLHLRHDLATPLDVVAEILALVEAGIPVEAEDEA